MIEKIIGIANVGKFTDYRARGDVSFRRLTLIYAENAKGKTTLTAILRSLQAGEGRFVNERKTLGSTGPVSIELRINGTTVYYGPRGWSSIYPEMMIFDPVFVTQNVYSGDEINHEQRRNLHRFALGEQAVQLASRLDEIAEAIRDKNLEIRETRNQIQRNIQGNISIEDFIALPLVEEVDEAITAKEQEVQSLKVANTIREKSYLSPVNLPEIPFEEIKGLLAKTLPDISFDAERRVKDHISTCMDAQGEAWISKGLSYIIHNRCPFCGQEISEIDLIEAYRGYFSEAYNDLKEGVRRISEQVVELLSELALLDIQNAITTNQLNVEFWRQHIQGEAPSLDADIIRSCWLALRDAIQHLLDQKNRAPLELIAVDEALTKAWEEYEQSRAALDKYNARVQRFNRLITEKKNSLGGKSVSQAENDLLRLKNTKVRYSREVSGACERYIKLQEEKRLLEEEREQKRRELEEQTQQMLQQYQDCINQYLRRFGADFEIIDTTEQYYGGTPRLQYCLSIRGQKVDLDVDDSTVVPSFGNTLSSGDKTTLALAFFLARIDSDTRINHKIIILDDPLSSMDGHRRMQTCQEILHLTARAKQVIVLSHDPYFLRMLWDGMLNNKNDVKTLTIIRSGGDSTIIPWDIERETRGEYFRNYCALAEYLEHGPSGDLRDVARCIRPLLEGNLRVRFPGCFGADYSLGDMILAIEQSQGDSPLVLLKSIHAELKDIHEYAKRYHHGDNPNASSEPISDGELRAYVMRTLRVLGGIFSVDNAQ